MSRSLLAALLLVGAAIVPPSGLQAAERCDRDCLRGHISAYVDAMVAHDVTRLPLARDVKFTENGVAIPLGEGLWTGISQAGSYRFDYLDPDSGHAASHLNFVEGDRPGLMSLRLRIVEGRIAEVETVLSRGSRNATRMAPTEALWNEIEPAASRLSRDQLAAVAESYLNAIASSDGTLAPFDETSCVRLENGGVMAAAPGDRPPAPLPSPDTPEPWLKFVATTIGMGCSDQVSMGIYKFITSYNNARFPVIDVERQIVFGQWNFRRRGDVKGFTWKGQFIPFMDTMKFPNENLLGQAFKIRGGKIVRVQGVFFNANVYKAGTGWGPGRDGKVAGLR